MKKLMALLISLCLAFNMSVVIFADVDNPTLSSGPVWVEHPSEFRPESLPESVTTEPSPRADIISKTVTLDPYEWSGWVYSENRKTNRVLEMSFSSATCRKVDVEVYRNGVFWISRAITEGEKISLGTPWDSGLVEIRINNNSNSRATIDFLIVDMWV